MVDVWSGGSSTTGSLKWELNADKTAIRFSLTTGAVLPDVLPQIITNTVAEYLLGAVSLLDKTAEAFDKIDTKFAEVLRAQADFYQDLKMASAGIKG